ncbi:hypothetical protein [Abditibacterium utsteinense]|nr:hypothetical protein [Abditibacterium utsteinense]
MKEVLELQGAIASFFVESPFIFQKPAALVTKKVLVMTNIGLRQRF